MSDFEQILVECSESKEIVRTLNDVRRAVPIEVRKRLNEVFTQYLVKYGLEGAYARVNKRTLAQIFAEFQREQLNRVASGEMNELQWTLYEAPGSDTEPDEQCEKK